MHAFPTLAQTILAQNFGQLRETTRSSPYLLPCPMYTTMCLTSYLFPCTRTDKQHATPRQSTRHLPNYQLMPISGCDKVRPMNSASNLQFFLLHAATLPSRGTCYRQVPRGDWQHRPEGPHPQRMSSWGDPSTDISDISASKLQ